MGNRLYNNPSDYLADQPVENRTRIEQIKTLILEVFPTASELINYNILAYSLIKGGKRDHQIMVAGFKNHIGFYPSPETIKNFSADLVGYKHSKGSIQFPLHEPLPKTLILKMLNYRKSILEKNGDCQTVNL